MAVQVAERIGTYAFYSRLLVIIIQLFFNSLMPDHDAGVFSPPSIMRRNMLDYWLEYLLSGLRRWDAVYFTHIAQYGYTYENTLAFFPLYPMLIRLGANTIFFPLQYILNYANVLLLTAVCLNIYLFVKSAVLLYEVGVKVLRDEALAFKAAQLYCVNPASIFFSAVYSESLFAFLVFNGMLHSEKENNLKASFYFGISGCTRSNGLVNYGFILYRKGIRFLKSIVSAAKSNIADNKTAMIAICSISWLTATSVALYTFFCFFPFAIFQYYAYTVFCNKEATYKDTLPHIQNYGNEKGYKMPHTGLSSWCSQTLPFSYNYVQDTHWNVGFLRYYEFKQIPNFLLAAPMAVICLAAILSYCWHNTARLRDLSVRHAEFYKKYDEEQVEPSDDDHSFYTPRCFPHIVQLAFLLTFCMLFMHVQVLTRFIASSCPVMYWFLASIITPEEQRRPQRHNQYNVFRHPDATDNGDASSHDSDFPSITEELMDWDNTGIITKLIYLYFHLYFFVGTAAFSNFLPFT